MNPIKKRPFLCLLEFFLKTQLHDLKKSYIKDSSCQIGAAHLTLIFVLNDSCLVVQA